MAEIRGAVRAQATTSSLRAVASDVGVNHTTLRKFEGGSHPRGRLRDLLVGWYGTRGESAGSQSLLPEPDLKRVRDAVRAEAAATSLRAVARQVGISVAAVRDFVGGSTPRGPTRQQLAEWHMRRCASIDTETTGTAEPSIEALRDAARAAVSASSVREVARRIGLTNTSISKFLAGSEPKWNTRRKFAEWYRERCEAEEAAAAHRVFEIALDGLYGEFRERTRMRLLWIFAEGFDQSGVPRPRWLLAMLSDQEGQTLPHDDRPTDQEP